MYTIDSKETISTTLAVRTFQHREYLPMIQGVLWQIDSGVVRAITVHQNGTVNTLGLWSVGDIVGYPLAGIGSYQIECLGEVRVHRFQTNDCRVFNQILLSHINQSQALLMIRYGLREDRLRNFLILLAKKFGQNTKEGYCIPHSLTYQDIAEAIDSSRATVTRLIRKLEQEGIIHWSRSYCLLYYDSQNQFSLTFT